MNGSRDSTCLTAINRSHQPSKKVPSEQIEVQLGHRVIDSITDLYSAFYINDLFLTLVRRPMQGRVGVADRVRGWFGNARFEIGLALAHELDQLSTARDALIAQFGSYEPRLLSVYETRSGVCSEPLEFLSALYNAEMRPVLLPHQDVGPYLP